MVLNPVVDISHTKTANHVAHKVGCEDIRRLLDVGSKNELDVRERSGQLTICPTLKIGFIARSIRIIYLGILNKISSRAMTFV